MPVCEKPLAGNSWSTAPANVVPAEKTAPFVVISEWNCHIDGNPRTWASSCVATDL